MRESDRSTHHINAARFSSFMKHTDASTSTSYTRVGDGVRSFNYLIPWHQMAWTLPRPQASSS